MRKQLVHLQVELEQKNSEEEAQRYPQLMQIEQENIDIENDTLLINCQAQIGEEISPHLQLKKIEQDTEQQKQKNEDNSGTQFSVDATK